MHRWLERENGSVWVGRGWGIKTEVVWERGDPVWTPELRPGLQADSSI